MFRMRRMFELLLQMDESARGLDQALEILRVVGGRRPLEPDLLENIVRLIITLLVPAAKKRPVIGMIGDRAAAGFASPPSSSCTNWEILSPLLMEAVTWRRLR